MASFEKPTSHIRDCFYSVFMKLQTCAHLPPRGILSLYPLHSSGRPDAPATSTYSPLRSQHRKLKSSKKESEEAGRTRGARGGWRLRSPRRCVRLKNELRYKRYVIKMALQRVRACFLLFPRLLWRFLDFPWPDIAGNLGESYSARVGRIYQLRGGKCIISIGKARWNIFINL